MSTLKTSLLIIGALFVAVQLWRFILGPLLHLLFGLIPLALFIVFLLFLVGVAKKR